MMTSFRVKNYKCLRDVEVALTPIHVVIGQNDTGKTALLEAMLALHNSTRMLLSDAFSGEWQGRDLVNEDAEQPWIDLGAGFEYDEYDGRAFVEYGLRIRFPEVGHACQPTKEEVTRLGRTDHFPANSNQFSAAARPNNLPEDSRGAAQTVAHLMGAAHLYRFDPKQMMLPAAPDPDRKFRMDPDGFGLATMLDDLLSYEPERFIALRERFIEFYPEFRGVRLETEPAVMRNYQASGRHQSSQAVGKGIFFETRGRSSIRAQQASDGAVLFLGLLALSYIPRPPSRLLIEEPERGVYPKRLEQVIRLLQELEEKPPGVPIPQIVMTTHSPFLLSFFKPEQVTLMSREGGDGPVRARGLRDAPHIEERLNGGEFYLGELWYNLSEEELFADAR